MSELEARMTGRLTAPCPPGMAADVADLAWALRLPVAEVIRGAVGEHLAKHASMVTRGRKQRVHFTGPTA